MPTHIPTPIVLGSILLLVPGSARAQEDPTVARAIEQLGSESPAARARARTAILRAGDAALDALRRAISASDEVMPELLFVIAEDLGRERRSVRFALSKDLREPSWQIAWRSGGQELGILNDHGGTVSLFDANLEPTGEQFGGKTQYFAFGPLDKSDAYNSAPGEIAIVERQSQRRVRVAVAETPRMAYSPDGRHVATGGYGLVADMWSVADGTHVHGFRVEGTEGGLTPVFSPDGKLLVVGNRNDKTYLFDVASGEVVRVLDRKQTQQPVFSPDGKLLALGYVDGKIGLWSPATGKLEKLLDGGVEEVFTLAWSPDGKLLASAGESGPIVIWSGEHLAKLHTLDPGSECTFQLEFRPDGEMLVAAGNHTTRAWTVESKQ